MKFYQSHKILIFQITQINEIIVRLFFIKINLEIKLSSPIF